ncbi:MAG: riboflavin synthase [Proteobacteria bacterium]|nr:riboflavin synthase [Pseudomonadota bacterium]
MFTGIIEGFGTFRSIRPAGLGTRFAIESDFPLDQTKIGDSIAVNGACLTAVTLNGRRFEVDVAPETLAKTTFSQARVGDRVNLERALRLSDRLDGHLVSGHIDGTGVMTAKETLSNAVIVTVSLPPELLRYMILKGSVAIDGISLTINKLNTDSIELSIIPHTAKITSIGFKKPGDRVNIETDVIGKYVEIFVTGKNQGPGRSDSKGSISGLDKSFLLKTGFL